MTFSPRRRRLAACLRLTISGASVTRLAPVDGCERKGTGPLSFSRASACPCSVWRRRARCLCLACVRAQLRSTLCLGCDPQISKKRLLQPGCKLICCGDGALMMMKAVDCDLPVARRGLCSTVLFSPSLSSYSSMYLASAST